MGELSVLCFCSVLLFLGVFEISTAAITITPSQSIKDGETVISGGGRFELGFFTAGNSKNRYLGIWYKKISPPTFVWVANRETPITDSSGILKLADGGILTLLNSTGGTVWHSSNSSKSAQNPIAQLLESGNFVVRDENDDNPENIIWQSFDYPCDTFLPGMKLGLNLQTGLDWHLTSWRSNDDPSRGEYTLRLDPRGFPQLVLRSGSVEQFRIGPFGGTPHLSENPVYKFIFASNDKEMYYGYELLHNNSSILTRVVLSQAGTVQRFTWSDRTQAWELYLSAQTDNCDIYASCGAYGSCDVGSSPECQCLKGFVPKPPKAGGRRDGSNGCVRRMPLNCRDGHGSDGFLMHSGIKLPDTRNAQFHKWLNLEGCRTMCLMNCSCTAYSNVDVSGAGGGCFLWFDDLIDIRVFKQNGQDIYVRVASAEIDSVRSGSNRRKRLVVVVSSTLSMGMLLLGLGLALCFLRKKRLSRQGKEDLEIASFDYAAISRATNHFSTDNKLGEGGFGPVYKGTLDGGQEIAVKVLSKDSRQGFDEFKNEVVFITKLQHRNLVKILGCCIQREKMLIYEYMPNKSLDYFIFDKTQSTLLDWPKRFHIIDGIARGLLYLHQDSRLRIIHRDLKLSNILLDYEMNPKISDFGLAKSFGGNETEASTTRVVGTHGYMSPEYAIDGHFSIKSDVFSLGVLVLEIVSGKRNRRFNHPDHYLNLLGHAWKLYNENRLHELIDPSVGISCNLSKVFRTIHVALLCVQQLPQDRPTMPSVVLMLGSDSQLPRPKQPGFYTQRRALDADPSGNKDESLSANGISVTLLEAR